MIGTVEGGKVTLLNMIKGGVTTLTVPAGRLYHLDWASILYTADATVATRYCHLHVKLVNLTYQSLAFKDVTASQAMTISYNVIAGYIAIHATSFAYGGGKPFTMYPGQVLEFVPNGEVAGDAWKGEILYRSTPLEVG